MRKAVSTKYLNRLQDIVTKISKELEIPESDVKTILDHFFKWFKASITDPRMPTIHIRYLGRFKPDLSIINYWIRKNIKFTRLNVITKEVFWSRILPYWKIRNRLIKEKKGDITWKEWRKINPETFGKDLNI